jgi:hypothetical protein
LYAENKGMISGPMIKKMILAQRNENIFLDSGMGKRYKSRKFAGFWGL